MTSNRSGILVLILLCFTFLNAFAAGGGEKLPEKPVQAPAEGTGLALPPLQKTSFFGAIKDISILSDIEIGSPDSIRSAVSKLRQNSLNFSEPEKVLLLVAAAIFTTAYPTEKITWDVPPVAESNPYVEIIRSIQIGAYDNNTGVNDYLSKVLPSLVLFTAPSVTNYYAEAEAALKQILPQKANAVLAPYLLGEILQRQNKIEQALQYFERAYSASPSCSQTANAYGRSLFKSGKFSEAFLLAEKLLAQNPKNIEAAKLCADTAFALKDWKSAEQYVAQILQNDPANQTYLLLRIRILLESAEYLKASSLFDVYSRTDKTSKDYFIVRLRLQRDWNKNLQAASATAQEALKLYPNDEELLLLSADLAAQTGQKIAGLTGTELAQKVTAINPQSPTALAILVSDAVKNKQWQAAYEQASKLRQMQSNEANNLLFIEACLGVGQVSEALDLARRLYQNNSANENVQYAYIRTLIAARQSDEASRLINSLLPQSSLRQKSNLYYELSLLTANEELKLDRLRSSLTANPRNQNALYDLYLYYYDKKDYRKAQYYLKQAVSITPNDQNLLKMQTELDNLLAR